MLASHKDIQMARQLLNTPALQTNFSPFSLAFGSKFTWTWRIVAEAGQTAIFAIWRSAMVVFSAARYWDDVL